MTRKSSLPKGVEVYEIDGPFFFGVANKFDGIMKSMGDKPKVRIIRMRKVSFIDSTGLHNLESLFRLSEAEHIHMILSGVNEHVHRVLTKSGFDKKIGAENICSNINEAVESESCRTRLRYYQTVGDAACCVSTTGYLFR